MLALVNSTNAPPDFWFIGFESEVEPKVHELLNLLKKWPWIVPVWQVKVNGEYELPHSCFERAVAEKVRATDNFIITTRVDNDDPIHKDFLEDVHTYASAVCKSNRRITDFWLLFPIGGELFESNIFLRCYPSNPFLSRVEKCDNLQGKSNTTVMSISHSKVFDRPTVFEMITAEPMWLMHFHGQNVLNKNASRTLRLDDADLFAKFGLLPTFGDRGVETQ